MYKTSWIIFAALFSVSSVGAGVIPESELIVSVFDNRLGDGKMDPLVWDRLVTGVEEGKFKRDIAPYEWEKTIRKGEWWQRHHRLGYDWHTGIWQQKNGLYIRMMTLNHWDHIYMDKIAFSARTGERVFEESANFRKHGRLSYYLGTGAKQYFHNLEGRSIGPINIPAIRLFKQAVSLATRFAERI